MTASGCRLNKRTLERVAACEAVGLSYWSNHPAANHVWAVDDHQLAHVVRVGRGDQPAEHICQASSAETGQCAGYTELEEAADHDVDRLNTR